MLVLINQYKRQNHSNVFVPYFLTERSVRTVLQNIYAAIVGSTANAIWLSKQYPSSPMKGIPRGSPLVKDCFISSLVWLQNVQEFIHSELFLEYVLKPSRSASRSILLLRAPSNPSATLDGVIFSKSSPYYIRSFRDKMVTLSVILPQIESVMNLRCRESVAKNIELGSYSICGAQPVHFVNRLHKVSDLTLKTYNKEYLLSDFDFIKVSTHDLDSLSQSFAFENLCQIETNQVSEKRLRLGFPCILGGTVVAISLPKIIFQTVPNSENNIEMILHEPLLLPNEIGSVESFQGRFVRVLAVWWWSGLQSEDSLYPEVFAIEQATDYSALVSDDVMAYIRIRSRVRKETISSLYVEFSSRHPEIGTDDQYMRWEPSDGQALAPTLAGLLRIKRGILKKRANLFLQNGIDPLVTVESLFDSRKLRKINLKSLLQAHPNHKNLLMNLIRETEDNAVEYEVYANSAGAFDCLQWLRNVGLVTKKTENVIVTELGLNIGYACYEGDIEIILNTEKSNLINAFIFSEKHAFPSSFVRRKLTDLENKGEAQCARLSGRRCPIFWYIIPAKEEIPANLLSLFREQLDELIDTVMSVLSSVPHSYAIEKIVEITEKSGRRLKSLEAKYLLAELVAEGIVTVDGSSWLYPWKNRIQDLFLRYPDSFFTLEEVIKRTHVVPAEKNAVLQILFDLEKMNKVSNVLSRWTSVIDLESKVCKLVRLELRSYILKILSKNLGSMYKERLSGFALHFSGSLPLSLCKLRPFELYTQVMKQMYSHKEIFYRGEFVCLISSARSQNRSNIHVRK